MEEKSIHFVLVKSFELPGNMFSVFAEVFLQKGKRKKKSGCCCSAVIRRVDCNSNRVFKPASILIHNSVLISIKQRKQCSGAWTPKRSRRRLRRLRRLRRPRRPRRLRQRLRLRLWQRHRDLRRRSCPSRTRSLPRTNCSWASMEAISSCPTN